MGATQEEVESLIVFLAKSEEPQRLLDVTNQIAQLSTDEFIPLDRMADHIKRQQEEIQRIKEEIEKACAILEEKNVDIRTIEQYKI